MSAKWDRMDKVVWDKSVVIKEFEKNILDSIISYSKKLDNKVAQSSLSKIPEDLAKVNQQAGTAATNLNNIANAIKKIYSPSADDGILDNEAKEIISKVIENLESLKEIFLKADDKDSAKNIELTIAELHKELNGEAEEGEEEKEDLITELNSLANSLADQGETALAYKVERLIREIEDAKDED